MIVVLTVVKNINVTLMGSTSESWESWRNDAFFFVRDGETSMGWHSEICVLCANKEKPCGDKLCEVM